MAGCESNGKTNDIPEFIRVIWCVFMFFCICLTSSLIDSFILEATFAAGWGVVETVEGMTYSYEGKAARCQDWKGDIFLQGGPVMNGVINPYLGDGFKDFLFSPRKLIGEDDQNWRAYFSNGLVRPPTSYKWLKLDG